MSAFAKNNPNMVFLNYRVSDVSRSVSFFTDGLGFTKDANFSTADTACINVMPNVILMLHDPARFAGWLPSGKTHADPARAAEVLTCLSSGTREGVDELVEKARKAGGKVDPTKIPEMPMMYGRSFEDPDGHIWEVCWMDMEAHKKWAEEHPEGGCPGSS